jgi:hypothetical protein
MFITDPDRYLLPAYRISPFTTSDIVKNHNLPDSRRADDYFEDRFSGDQYCYTLNGREALNIALRQINPGNTDSIAILTTSGNHYISSCVTGEIEKFCTWTRSIVAGTKAVLVNHEFGYPYPDLDKLKATNLPVIEDCAGSFFSEDKDHTIGRRGDYVIYSFPKMFPLQIGGMLVSRSGRLPEQSSALQPGARNYIRNVLSDSLKSERTIIKRRLENYRALRERFGSLGLDERFSLSPGIVPGVFMFRTGKLNLDLPDLKRHFWAHGIQSSVFYGEDAFFIPVHQGLEEGDLDYFREVMKAFIQKVDK